LAGGFRAVVKTDIVQTIGIFLLVILMIYLLFTSEGSIAIVPSDLFSLPFSKVFSFFLVGLFTPMASPELWQRVYAIKDEGHLKKSLILSSLFYFIIGFILLLIGLTIRTHLPGINPDDTLIRGFSSLLPAGMAGLSVIIVYSAISSSADTYLFTSAASITQDVMEKLGFSTKEKLRVNMRVNMTVLMILGISMALLLKNIVDTTFFFAALTMSLGFLMIIMWIYPRINRASVNLSISFCLIGVIIPSYLHGISTILVIYALGFCALGVLVGILLKYMRAEKI
jgi:SSS family solute:Na+ symporter